MSGILEVIKEKWRYRQDLANFHPSPDLPTWISKLQEGQSEWRASKVAEIDHELRTIKEFLLERVR